MSYTPRVFQCCVGIRCGIKRVEIGDWDMDTVAQKSVAHGLPLMDIRQVTVCVRNDADTARYQVAGKDSSNLALEVSEINNTNVVLDRMPGQFFDSADFDSTSYNRGWVSVTYKLGG